MRLLNIFIFIALMTITCEKNPVKEIPYNKLSHRVVREDGCTIDTLVKDWEEFDYGTWSYPGEDGWRKCYWVTYANKNINEDFSNFESIIFKIPVKTDSIPVSIKAGFSSLYNRNETVKIDSIEVYLTKTVLINYQMDSLVNWSTNQPISPDSVQMIEFQIEPYSESTGEFIDGNFFYGNILITAIRKP